jgi:hypothetical protein
MLALVDGKEGAETEQQLALPGVVPDAVASHIPPDDDTEELPDLIVSELLDMPMPAQAPSSEEADVSCNSAEEDAESSNRQSSSSSSTSSSSSEADEMIVAAEEAESAGIEWPAEVEGGALRLETYVDKTQNYARLILACPVHTHCRKHRNTGLKQCERLGPREPLSYLACWARAATSLTAERHVKHAPTLADQAEWLRCNPAEIQAAGRTALHTRLYTGCLLPSARLNRVVSVHA